MSICCEDRHALFVSVTQMTLFVELRNNSCVKLCRLAVFFSILIINIEISRFLYKNLFIAENLPVYNHLTVMVH